MFLADEKTSPSKNGARNDVRKMTTTTTMATSLITTNVETSATKSVVKFVENSNKTERIYSGKYSVESIVNGGKKRKMSENEMSDKILLEDNKCSNPKRSKTSEDGLQLVESQVSKR